MVFGLMLNVVESSGTTPVVFVEAEAWGSIPHSPTPFPIGVPLRYVWGVPSVALLEDPLRLLACRDMPIVHCPVLACCHASAINYSTSYVPPALFSWKHGSKFSQIWLNTATAPIVHYLCRRDISLHNCTTVPCTRVPT